MLPVLQDPLSAVGGTADIPGKQWNHWPNSEAGRASKAKTYSCTVVEFDALHLEGAIGMFPSAAFMMQDEERADDGSTITFWVSYPNPFLSFWYAKNALPSADMDVCDVDQSDEDAEDAEDAEDDAETHPSAKRQRETANKAGVYQFAKKVRSEIIDTSKGKEQARYYVCTVPAA